MDTDAIIIVIDCREPEVVLEGIPDKQCEIDEGSANSPAERVLHSQEALLVVCSPDKPRPAQQQSDYG